MKEIPPKILEILHLNYFGYLCTLESDLQPHITPIFFVYDHRHKTIYFLSDIHSKKINNILKNPEVALTVDERDESDPFNNEGLLIRGRATVHSPEEARVDMLPEIYEIYEIFKSKYRQFMTVSKSSRDVLVSIEIFKISHWVGPIFTTVKLR